MRFRNIVLRVQAFNEPQLRCSNRTGGVRIRVLRRTIPTGTCKNETVEPYLIAVVAGHPGESFFNLCDNISANKVII